jgi:hypothetical protein
MRLKQYITENNDIVDIIKKDCKPWLKESKGLPGWRGSMKEFEKIIKKQVRKNRKPLNIAPKMHKIIDNVFKEKFGWNARSNVVFVQGSQSTNYYYGPHRYAIFPIGNFKYIWSKKITDLMLDIEKIMYKISDEGIPEFSEEWYNKFKEIMDKSVINLYSNKDLYMALTKYKYNEIMVKCKDYYMIPNEIYFEIGDKIKG